MTKTLNQIFFFFLHQNQNIFFSNIGNQNIFLHSISSIKINNNCEKYNALTFNWTSDPIDAYNELDID